jgi:hypothetical protein
MPDIDKDKPSRDIGSTDAHEDASRQSGQESKGDPSSEMACSPYGELAADAAAHLERSGSSLEGFGGDSQEIERQAANLIVWAREKSRILPEEYTTGLFKHQSTTAEHEVFYRASDNRAVKCTYPGTFGVTPDPKGAQRAATPLFYLRRLELMNRVFKSELRLEGIILGKSLLIGAKGEQPSVVISQAWIRPADPNLPHPSNAEIAEFMAALGFDVLSRSYYGWRRKNDGITILDARADNFIKSPEGVVPIDLVISQGKTFSS